jgi:hypothetical protein
MIENLKAGAACLFWFIAILRMYWVWALPSSRGAKFVWTGTVALALALSVNQHMVSESILASSSQNPNLFHVIRCLLAFTGAYCFRIGVVEHQLHEKHAQINLRRELGLWAVGAAVMGGSFSLIRQYGLSHRFIPEHLDQWPTMIYGVSFMLFTAWQGVELAVCSWRGPVAEPRRGGRFLQRCLAFSVALISGFLLSEAWLLIMGHLGIENTATVVTRTVFDAGVLGSTVLLALTVLVMGTLRLFRALMVKWHLIRLTPLWKYLGAQDVVVLPSRPGLKAALAWDSELHLYRVLIAIDDALERQEHPLDLSQKRLIESGRKALKVGG